MAQHRQAQPLADLIGRLEGLVRALQQPGQTTAQRGTENTAGHHHQALATGHLRTNFRNAAQFLRLVPAVVLGHQVLLLHLLGEFHLPLGVLDLPLEVLLALLEIFMLVEVFLQGLQLVLHLAQVGLVLVNAGAVVLEQRLGLGAEQLILTHPVQRGRLAVRPLGNQPLGQFLLIILDFGDLFSQVLHIRMVLAQALAGELLDLPLQQPHLLAAGQAHLLGRVVPARAGQQVRLAQRAGQAHLIRQFLLARLHPVQTVHQAAGFLLQGLLLVNHPGGGVFLQLLLRLPHFIFHLLQVAAGVGDGPLQAGHLHVVGQVVFQVQPVLVALHHRLQRHHALGLRGTLKTDVQHVV